ncbi:hypothetical protein LSAT2_004699 [Lamellibrachia satsuma]|nr:hypothetical protein LSAT2_004699 [Lamellibrachia satsuma]
MSTILVSKMSDDELRRIGVDGLVHQLRRCDRERLRSLADHSKMMMDVNNRLQTHLMEIRGLKEVNRKLMEENQELRDLCCFLDDERERSRKLAREWQKFGRYTSDVMKSEVATYQQKLNVLEARQEELVKENFELKELCIYLDQDRNDRGETADRDQGDGSSSSSPVNEKVDELPTASITGLDRQAQEALQKQDVRANGEPTLQYVRQLEDRITHLEQERTRHEHAGQRVDRGHPREPRKFFSTPQLRNTRSVIATHSPAASPGRPVYKPSDCRDWSQPVRTKIIQQEPSPALTKPDAIACAMKVLEVHDQLEQPRREMSDHTELDDRERAIVKEMCNVVWRKLGNVVPGYKPDL